MAAIRRAAPLWLTLMLAWTGAMLVAGPATSSIERHRMMLAGQIADHGRLMLAPQAPGFELLIAPAWAAGGETAIRIWLAALTAFGFCFAAALGRRVVPEPWATRAALVVGLSPPMLGAATAISPGGAGAACLAGSMLMALRVRDSPRLPTAFWSAAGVGALPWLAIKLAAPSGVLALGLWRWLRRRRQRMAGLVALEIIVFTLVLYVMLSDRLFGVLTPSQLAHGGPTGAHGLGAHLERAPRLWTTLFGLESGVVLWAPMLVLAGAACWHLARGRREGLWRALPEQLDVDATAAFLVAVTVAVWLTAAFLAPSIGTEGREWSHGRQIVPALPLLAALCAWGWRRMPRSGTGLAAVTVLLSVLMVAGVID